MKTHHKSISDYVSPNNDVSQYRDLEYATREEINKIFEGGSPGPAYPEYHCESCPYKKAYKKPQKVVQIISR